MPNDEFLLYNKFKLLIFLRGDMANYQISQKIRSRKSVLFYSVVIVLVLVLALVAFLLTRNSKIARAWVNTPDNLTVAEDDMLYIGPGGYIAQRMWSQDGQPLDIGKISSFQTADSAPAGHVYTSSNVINLKVAEPGNIALGCPDRYFQPGSTYTGQCMALRSDGTGMIVRYNDTIIISGTVFVTDRVVLEAPNIIITHTARIIASGQDGHLGFGDSCGVGGIGGMIGGTSSSNTIGPAVSPGDDPGHHQYVSCQGNKAGNEGYQNSVQAPGIKALSDDVAKYFTMPTNYPIYGGVGGDSSEPIDGAANYGFGTAAMIGVGGAGASGATGATLSKDHGSSGGGGGGFGIVFKASQNLEVDESAYITAAGGNSTVSSDGNSQYPGHGHVATGGFGGPGGGGVIVVDAANVDFKRTTCRGFPRVSCITRETAPNYEIFNVSAGRFLVYQDQTARQAPALAYDGKLIILPDLGKNVSIKKSLNKVNGSGSPYSVQLGDVIEVTLDVSNLIPGQAVVIKDEFFNDAGTNFASFQSCTDSCISSGADVTWNLDPTLPTKTLKYVVKIN